MHISNLLISNGDLKFLQPCSNVDTEVSKGGGGGGVKSPNLEPDGTPL